jgi:hypothetical protein
MSIANINALREKSIQRYISYPAHCRLPGMHRDITDEERRWVACLDAALELLRSKGVDVPEYLIPKPYEHISEVIEGN